MIQRSGRGGMRRAGMALSGAALFVGSAATGQAPAVEIAASALPGRARLPTEYRINAGDELDVFVWGEDRMQRTVRVLPDGTIAFPLAGTLRALGRTAQEVSGDIRQRIAGNYRAGPPDVTVSVREAAGMRFYVIGKVRTPGSFSTGQPVDIVQALSMAGGLAEFADTKHSVILRQTPAGQVVEPVKLAAILAGGRRLDAGALAQPLPVLRSGDVLVVP